MNDQSKDIVKVSASEQVGAVGADLNNQIAFFLYKRIAQEVSPFEKSIVIREPFNIDGEFLKNLDQQCSNLISSDDNLATSKKFMGVADYDDLSSSTYDSFESFSREIGSRMEPLSISLEWETFRLEHITKLHYRRIVISFITERKFAGNIPESEENQRAEIILKISGVDEVWVDAAYQKIQATLRLSLFDKALRWLEAFRKPLVSQVFVQTISWAGFYIALQIVRIWIYSGLENRINRTFQRIVDFQDLGAKINELAYSIWYAASQPWWYMAVPVIAGMVFYTFLLAVTKPVISMLAPISIISIGAAARTSQDRLNWYKWRIVTVMLGAIFIPFLIASAGKIGRLIAGL